MIKFTCFVLCAVVVNWSSVYAGEDQSTAVHDAFMPMVNDCVKELGISEADVRKARESHSADDVDPCFVSCVFKKAEIINSKGEFDVDSSLAAIKKHVKNEEYFAKISEVGQKCKSVNEEAVSDGDAGCERAMLLVKCFREHKSEIHV